MQKCAAVKPSSTGPEYIRHKHSIINVAVYALACKSIRASTCIEMIVALELLLSLIFCYYLRFQMRFQ